MKIIKWLILPIPLLLCIFVHGQTASPQYLRSSGGSFLSSIYQLDWNVGEIQMDNFTISSIKSGELINDSTTAKTILNNSVNLDISAYPNPTKDFIHVKISNLDNNFYTLTDVNGILVKTDLLKSDMQIIDITEFTSGFYFLSFYSKDKLLKTIKIIKIN